MFLEWVLVIPDVFPMWAKYFWRCTSIWVVGRGWLTRPKSVQSNQRNSLQVLWTRHSSPEFPLSASRFYDSITRISGHFNSRSLTKTEIVPSNFTFMNHICFVYSSRKYEMCKHSPKVIRWELQAQFSRNIDNKQFNTVSPNFYSFILGCKIIMSGCNYQFKCPPLKLLVSQPSHLLLLSNGFCLNHRKLKKN